MKKKKFGIKGKMTALFVVMGTFVSLCVGIGVFTISYRQVSAQYSERAFSSAKAAAMLVNGDSIDHYMIYGKDDEYRVTYEALQELKIEFGLTFVYILVSGDENNTTARYVFDIFVEGDDASQIGELGEIYSDSDAAASDSALQTFLTGQIEDTTVVSLTGYGWLASAFVPIYASDGTITAVIGVDISMNRIVGDIFLQTLQILAITIVVIILFLCILRFITGKQILVPITNLSTHMSGFDPENGSLEMFDIPESGDEFQNIAESFNNMAGAITYYMSNLATVTADRERIATELDVATQIQASMLPCTFPAFPQYESFDIFAAMYPAREVGGDFYDFFLIDKNTLAVVIADVSDKGIPAALFMVIARTLIKNTALDNKPPKEVFDIVNTMLCENNEAEMFVTAFMGYFDIPSGRFTYVNAGHNPPLIRQKGVYRFLEVDSGLMLAVIDGIEFVQEELILENGDLLCLYTDGVTEAMTNARQLFTSERLLNKANEYAEYSANRFILKIKEEIDIFAEYAAQADDITMLALEIK